ncbi:response regulator [Pseudoalteromonas ruthenica]|uniref:XRE family transcriptional regulator n=1 Tax=Pseudoalteromonas ruthenica TaxID=151081 RepID=A0A0F4PZ08_9GAMM|nr:response regulator [Pseudoalteromonas ruthenica]KJY95819.1 XRE family transcriptional regulator [Pseudoalteromonas ruthenica]KJZ00294.1 XRE family transcriptional regulator [Pseudoalteromonas ruthenica]TMO86083.1 DNA-binding response regulator [Pseudoalteromonas ruthenica]TMO90750.1 DNA-binding response regulator [Pseudoalteromonas ruthenica]TMP00987.1 DNA-binding response regulator [Pseudoalteromonas ruthenica]
MRLLLVEDDALLNQGLTRTLSNEGYAMESVSDLASARAYIASDDIDMVILDLGLPDGDGLTLMSQIKGRKKPLPVLILTARDSLDDKIKGLDLGADDYLVKPFEVDELLARLRVLSRRISGVTSSLLRCAALRLDLAAHQAWVEEQPLSLPRKEYMLLKALMENQGRVLSKEQLEQKLYQWGEELGSNAIEVHIHHLRKKLPANMIKTLRGIGYVLACEPQ